MELGDSAILVISQAQRARIDLDHRYLGVEHLFLGIAALDDPRLARPFTEAGESLGEAARRVREAASGELYPDGDYLGLTLRAKRVIERAERLAAAVRPEDEWSHVVWAPHILLAILSEDHGLPVRTLASSCVDVAALREAICELMTQEWTESACEVLDVSERTQSTAACSSPSGQGAWHEEPLMSTAPRADFEMVAGPNDGFTFAIVDHDVIFEGEVLGPPPGSGLGPKDLDDVEVEIRSEGVVVTCEVTFWLNGAEVTGTHLLNDGDVVRVGMTEMMLVHRKTGSAQRPAARDGTNRG